MSKQPPALVRLGSWLALVFGSFFVLGALVVSEGWTDVSDLQNSPLGSCCVLFWAFSALLVGLLLISIGYGFRKARPWARILVLVFWLVLGAAAALRSYLHYRNLHQFELGLEWVLGLGVAVWYFFVKPNVVGYYRSLRQEARA